MSSPSLENVYRLVVTSRADANVERVTCVLHLDATSRQWPAHGASEAIEVPSEVFVRLGILGRFPETNPAHRRPDARVVALEPAAASVDDIAAWLWERLPGPIRDELSRQFANETRLLVQATGAASVLPWHRLSAWSDEQVATVQPTSTRRWQVWMHVDGGPTKDAALLPRVLLLVGSQRQRPDVEKVEHSVLATVRAIRGAGFSCEVAAGKKVIADFDQSLGKWIPLDNPDQAARLIEKGDYDIVHFMGHSDATRRASQSPLGATALEFEFAGDAEPRRLDLRDLSKALRASSTRLLILHACHTRELVAHAVLDATGDQPGAVDAVLTMGAIANPGDCALFATKLYARWKQDGHLPAAIADATAALRSAGSDWMPIFWSRTRDSLRLADERERRLAAYCRWMLDTHRAFEGLFDDESQPDVLDRVALDLEISRDNFEQERLARQRVLQRVPPGEGVRFRHLIARGEWWTLGGGPGSGKTTTLRLHARELAKQRAVDLVPIYLPLASWLRAMQSEIRDQHKSENDWLFGFVERAARMPQSGLADDLRALAAENRLVVLLDGLDELSPELRTLLTEREGILARLRQVLEGCSLVIATRRYQSAKRLPQGWFHNADLCELQPADAVQLLGNFLRGATDTAAIAAQHVAWLQQELQRGAHLWVEVARTPLLVTLLARQLLEGKAPAESRLQFFEFTFDVLCRGRHRHQELPTPMPHESDALRILRYLAFRLTVAQTRSVPREQLLGWLEGRDEDAQLQPPADVVAALGERAKWMPVIPEHLSEAPSAALAFLWRVARDTQILGPEDTSASTSWRFWHRSFQEALCAFDLHARFVARKEEKNAVAAMLAALDRWLALGEPSDVAVQRHRDDLQAIWHAADTSPTHWTEVQREIINEAYAAATDDPIARNVRFNRMPDAERPAAWIGEVAKARARLEAFEALGQTLSLLTDRLADPGSLLHGLLQRSWLLAYRVALASHHVPAASLLVMLPKLPELGQRAALIEYAAHRCSAAHHEAMLRALRQRGRELAAWLRPGRAPSSGKERDWHRRRVWDAPGELHALLQASRALRGSPVLTAALQAAESQLLDCLPTPDPSKLQELLTLVPGRERERERGLTSVGVRLWRRVPAGEFWMGTEGGGPIGNEPRHLRCVEQPFWIGAVPVTVALYRLFSPQHEVWIGNGYRRVDDPQLDASTAVGCVSHHAARMFCRWLQHHAGAFLRAHLRDRGGDGGVAQVRLPKEVEWEYAARAGSETPFFFGDDDKHLLHWGWYGKGDRGAPHPVASFRGQPGVVADAPAAGANAFGLFDVHGNVWEWCQDWYEPDPRSERAQPRSSGRFRVLRGGSYRYDAGFCRSAYRGRDVPDGSFDVVGFRVVVSAPEPDL